MADVIGRDEADRAADVALARQGRQALGLGEALGQPEIGQLDAGPMHRAKIKQVRRLHVAVHVALRVGVVERLEQVPADRRAARAIGSGLFEPAIQSRAFLPSTYSMTS